MSSVSTLTEPAPGISAEEWQLRCDLAACYQLTDLYGMSDFFGTHISARVPGPEDHFLLNPFGILFDQITASSLIKVDLNGDVVAGESDQLNFAGFVIHSAVHMARPELICVMHTHTDANNGVGMQKEGLLPITQKALLLWHGLRYHDFEGAAFNLDERERLLADLGEDGRCMILRNHGALTVGRTISEAFRWMTRLETACRQQVAGMAGGRPLNYLSEEVIQRTIEQGRGGSMENMGASDRSSRSRTMGKLAERGTWESLLRKLERERGMSYCT
jgi:ribulose-5-phosphate 4-epimerase/fuculose-1-phosphate aldolase